MFPSCWCHRTNSKGGGGGAAFLRGGEGPFAGLASLAFPWEVGTSPPAAGGREEGSAKDC